MVKKEKDNSTEEKILAAAKKVFIARGMDGARMQDIADEAGINKAMLHYYFRSKEQLFETIFKAVSGRFISQLEELLASGLDFYQKIERVCEAYINMATENPFMPIFVLSEVNRQPGTFIKKMFGGHLPNLAPLAKQLQQEIKKGNIKKISTEQLVMHIWSLCVFPFIAKPLFSGLLNIDEKKYRALMEERKKMVPRLIIDSLKCS
ncbi:MAG: TetR/AcrR family transcriptional regulator [Ferruginibacter sp.]